MGGRSRRSITCVTPTIRLINVDSGRDLRRLVGHTQTIYALAFSPDGELLALSGFRPNRPASGTPMARNERSCTVTIWRSPRSPLLPIGARWFRRGWMGRRASGRRRLGATNPAQFGKDSSLERWRSRWDATPRWDDLRWRRRTRRVILCARISFPVAARRTSSSFRPSPRNPRARSDPGGGGHAGWPCGPRVHERLALRLASAPWFTRPRSRFFARWRSAFRFRSMG